MLPSSPGLAVSQSLLPGVSRIPTYLQWCQENPFSFCPQALLPTAPVSAEAAHRWRKTPGFPVRGGLLKHWIVGNKPQGWKEMAQYLKSTSYDLHIHVYAQAPIYIGAHLQTYLLNQKQNKTKQKKWLLKHRNEKMDELWDQERSTILLAIPLLDNSLHPICCQRPTEVFDFPPGGWGVAGDSTQTPG